MSDALVRRIAIGIMVNELCASVQASDEWERDPVTDEILSRELREAARAYAEERIAELEAELRT